MSISVGDIMELYEQERRELAKKEEQNYPYGKLDYIQVQGDPNLYYAIIPEPDPTPLDEMFDHFLTSVHSLEHQHINNPDLGGKLILDYLVDGHIIVARREDGERPIKVAWQRWYRNSKPNGEYEFGSDNSIANGPKMVMHYTTLFIDLDNFEVQSFPEIAIYKHPTHLSDIARALVRALLSHHVKGDQIVQGLRSKLTAFNTDQFKSLRIYQEYLGGWNIQLDGSKISAFTLINLVESVVSSPQ